MGNKKQGKANQLKAMAMAFLGLVAVVGMVAESKAGNNGTSVWGDEAREVYNTLLSAGATRVEIPEGPTVIVDRIDCVMSTNLTSAQCKFVGDPKLNVANGPVAIRMAKALLGINVHKKTIDANTATVGVNSLECGVLHNVPEQNKLAEEASCYFVDNN
jgi:hypothetical protein